MNARGNSPRAIFAIVRPVTIAAAGPPAAPAEGFSLFTALQEQLGLKLESERGPVRVLVIDHVERPKEDWTRSFREGEAGDVPETQMEYARGH
jgi:hypothetical protein